MSHLTMIDEVLDLDLAELLYDLGIEDLHVSMAATPLGKQITRATLTVVVPGQLGTT